MAQQKSLGLWHFVFPLILIFIISNPIKSEVFTSQSDLESLFQLRHEVNSAIETYLVKEENRLKFIKQKLQSSSGFHVEDNNNPISTYLLIKALTINFAELFANARNHENFKEFKTKIENLNANTPFPDYEDIEGAIVGLIRLQDTYNLDAKSLAKGVIGNNQSAPQLSFQDCFELGMQSYKEKHYNYSTQWFQEALKRYPSKEKNLITTPSKSEIQGYLQKSNENHNILEIGKNYLTQLNKEQMEAFVDQVDLNLMLIDDQDIITQLTHKELRERYKSLCRGDSIGQIGSKKADLKCYYCTRNKNRFYLIGPIKVELLNMDPPIWSFKNVIYPGEIEKIKDLAKPVFETAKTVNKDTGENERSESRISKSAWLKKDDDSIVNRVDIRTGHLTDLNMDTAEYLQIANYGIGGMYLPHYDFSLKGENGGYPEERGNRIATMLFYMSDVEMGGATVFPKLNLTLWPEKGSAVFWYNLKKSGDGDLRTLHAACPVLVGSKWVSNKWIHERGQEFRYKCGLKINEN